MARSNQPEWLHERNNDPHGTPGNHPFWTVIEFEMGRAVEKIGVWKIFQRDGVWYGYKTTQNAWAHFTTRDEAVAMATGPQIDIWA